MRRSEARTLGFSNRVDFHTTRQRHLATRLLQASSSEVGKIVREELRDNDLVAAHFVEGSDWDGPDICVYGTRGTYTVEVCNEPFPILKAAIEAPQVDQLGGPMETPTIRKQGDAAWLVRALHMRQDTLRRVAESFLKHQPAVWAVGSDRLKPVSVREVAESAGLHESTVERAVANKVMAIGGQRILFDSLVRSIAAN
jgi:DNA-directed RNA polymerase specialized sigma54-like protein